MTIQIYTGTPGSGKSADCARDIRYDLNCSKPRPVMANFKLAENAPVKRPDLFTYVPNDELVPEVITNWANDFWGGVSFFREDYLRLYIDEAQIIFNSRRWSDKGRMAFLELLSQSRKYGIKITMIAQSAKMIDNQFRMLIETEVNHRRVDKFGLVGGLVSLVTMGRLYARITYAFQVNERIGSEFWLLSKRDLAMYDSYAKFDAV